MNINKENAERLVAIASEMSDLLFEFKDICKDAMSKPEYERFRYNTLSNLEPGLIADSNWVVDSNIQSISVIADNAIEEATDEEEEEEEEENNICPDCGCDTTEKACDC